MAHSPPNWLVDKVVASLEVGDPPVRIIEYAAPHSMSAGTAILIAVAALIVGAGLAYLFILLRVVRAYRRR